MKMISENAVINNNVSITTEQYVIFGIIIVILITLMIYLYFISRKPRD